MSKRKRKNGAYVPYAASRKYQRRPKGPKRYQGGGELKFHDVDLDDGVIATGINVTPTVIIIPQGVTEKQRVGRKCTITNIGWRFEVKIPELAVSTGYAEGDVVRVVMFQDRQCNKATAVNTDIWETADYQSFRNLVNSKRFRILMDRTYSMNYSGGSGITASTDAPSVTLNDTFWKKCNIPVEYSAETGALTEITSNNIGVALMSKNGTAAFLSKLRFRFQDGS